MKEFSAAKTPELFFGPGSFKKIEKIIGLLKAKKIAMVTGESFRKTEQWKSFVRFAEEKKITVYDFTIHGEPSPEVVDSAAAELKNRNAELLIAVGGGSAVDAGKAVSAMIKNSGSVREYLEGIGDNKTLTGEKVPFLAVPTTSGTGSEATKNSVISSVGSDGFKKSLRHDCMVPDFAVIDPMLMLSCPADVTASSGMDAVTQLIESYVSTKASLFTDSLASAALACAGRSLEKAFREGSSIEARADMAWAAYVSGITLANAGLGVVHGIAGPAGGYSSVPHGVVCGTLIAPATRYITEKLLSSDPSGNGGALKKYAEIYGFLTDRKSLSVPDACIALAELLEKWADKFSIPLLDSYGFDKALALKTAKASDGKNSPLPLSTEDIYRIIMMRIRDVK